MYIITIIHYPIIVLFLYNWLLNLCRVLKRSKLFYKTITDIRNAFQNVVFIDSEKCTCSIVNPTDGSAPPKTFTFDGVYGPDSNTEQIYNDIAYPFVEVSNMSIMYIVKQKNSEYHNCLILFYTCVRHAMICIGHIRGLQLHGVCVRTDWMW